MVCVGPDGPTPTLTAAHLSDIRLVLEDPGTGRIAARLAWAWEDGDGEPATYFEIYQSLAKDSLGGPVRVQDASEPREIRLRLPDSGRPVTLYYGVRAVRTGPTGQKTYGDSIPVDSLIATPSLAILSPAPRSRQSGRELDVAVKTSSDGGIVLRQSLYEKAGGTWILVRDTCLPMDACETPILGSSIQRDVLLLPGLSAGDSLETLYCVFGDESFEDAATGRMQSLGCSRFHRSGP
jgi:hypothetical protein